MPSRTAIQGRVRLMRSVLLLGGVLLLATGCLSGVRFIVGTRPDLDVLERSLRVGESKQADVLAVLGTPSGKGSAMLPTDPKPRTMWTYYYGESTTEDSRRIFLFVYFDGDRYEGYMWFSSLPASPSGPRAEPAGG